MLRKEKGEENQTEGGIKKRKENKHKTHATAFDSDLYCEVSPVITTVCGCVLDNTPSHKLCK